MSTTSNTPFAVSAKLLPGDTDTFIIHNGALYERFDGGEIVSHFGPDFSNMKADEITDYIIDQKD